MGDANEVATMVNQLCKNITVTGQPNSKYMSVCKRLNGFYENPLNKYKAIFVHEYFNTPWKIASTVTAVLLLLFTLIQTSHTTESYLKNLLAFEECHVPDLHLRYIAQYISMLDFLIKTEKDVSILVDKKIITNWMRDANAVTTMVNNLCKNVSMPKCDGKYMYVCPRLNNFYKKSINKYKVSFLQEYFDTPWKTISSVSALLLLLLILIQTVCSYVQLSQSNVLL
ncbi:uncharacterized protein LOC131633820 [Vicia villosa]|uniref:uncharacterized protein LOC131633820 n=1 Tax=Vicia villosa TaxID=3911 RepID=UPI00273ACDD3|nr:uncharacterized protein LOC131633820 [Vicia villosa]